MIDIVDLVSLAPSSSCVWSFATILLTSFKITTSWRKPYQHKLESSLNWIIFICVSDWYCGFGIPCTFKLMLSPFVTSVKSLFKMTTNWQVQFRQKLECSQHWIISIWVNDWYCVFVLPCALKLIRFVFGHISAIFFKITTSYQVPYQRKLEWSHHCMVSIWVSCL